VFQATVLHRTLKRKRAMRGQERRDNRESTKETEMSHEIIKDRAGGDRKASALKVYGHIPTIKTVKTAVIVKTTIKHCRQVCKSYVRLCPIR
jgi:hypothetical protein